MIFLLIFRLPSLFLVTGGEFSQFPNDFPCSFSVTVLSVTSLSDLHEVCSAIPATASLVVLSFQAGLLRNLTLDISLEDRVDVVIESLQKFVEHMIANYPNSQV